MAILKKIGRWLLRGIIALVLFFAVLFALYLGWMWWDVRQLRGFCDEIKPGARIDALPALADKHGIDRRWINRRVKLQDGVATIVPAASTMGDLTCTIRHDDSTVLSVALPVSRD